MLTGRGLLKTCCNWSGPLEGRTTLHTVTSKVGLHRYLAYLYALGAYSSLKGCWTYVNFRLHVDYIQGDPYAPPSKFRIEMANSAAGFPKTLFSNQIR